MVGLPVTDSRTPCAISEAAPPSRVGGAGGSGAAGSAPTPIWPMCANAVEVALGDQRCSSVLRASWPRWASAMAATSAAAPRWVWSPAATTRSARRSAESRSPAMAEAVACRTATSGVGVPMAASSRAASAGSLGRASAAAALNSSDSSGPGAVSSGRTRSSTGPPARSWDSASARRTAMRRSVRLRAATAVRATGSRVPSGASRPVARAASMTSATRSASPPSSERSRSRRRAAPASAARRNFWASGSSQSRSARKEAMTSGVSSGEVSPESRATKRGTPPVCWWTKSTRARPVDGGRACLTCSRVSGAGRWAGRTRPRDSARAASARERGHGR